jgi:hypothetical protein
MKKRVRIYKSSDGEGKFINKTAQFLQRAQEGGVPDSNMMGYPGAQQQSQELTDDQLASVVLQDISNSAPREAIVVKLVNVFGKEPTQAMQFVDQMYNYVKEQQQSEIDSEDNEDEESEDIVSGNDVIEIAQPEEEEESQSGTDMSNEMILEDDGSDYDDNAAASDLIMQYGGYYKAQDGVEVPVEMPDLSAYLPQNISDYYGNSDYISQMAYPELEDETEEYQGFVAPDVPEDVDFDVARYGGSKKSKKQFVNSVLNLVKKQMGGPNEDSETSSNDADPTGSNVRKQNLDKFINSVKNESAIATAQKQAEEHYDQMMQQQMLPLNEEMQRGGRVVRGNKLRYKANQLRDFLTGRNRREENDYSNVDNNSSTGYESGDYNQDGYTDATDYAIRGQFDEQRPSYRVDVRKSNWLTGRPSKYTIDYYGQSPMPGMGSQNKGTGMYTLDGKIYRWPATRKKVEVAAASVNKDAIKEVATATPDSKATTKAAETNVTSTTSTSTQGTVAKDVKAGDIKETVTTTKNGKTTVVPTNYGTIDPSKMLRLDTVGNNFVTNYLDSQSETPVIKQRDTWGRPVGDKFYGYNPKTKKYEKGKLKNKYGGSMDYEIGGSVNDPFMDPYGNLQQFIDGGDENFTQADIDDVYSKNTANADFPESEYQRGGGVRRFIENYFPGNIVGPRRTYRNEIQRVYDPRTGKTVTMPINMGNLSSVNVDKSRFSGAPKKYTMYFNGQSGQPSTTSKGNTTSQSGRDRYCLDFPNSPNCQGGKKPVKDNYTEDTRENNKNQRSGRQGYGFMNDLKLRMQGLDEYGNPKGSKQSDKVPLSNEEMLIKQGKIWDEKSKRWIVKPEPLSAPMQYMKDSLTVPNNPQPFSSDQLINTSGPRNTEMQYGGGLEMFIPRAQDGFQTPLSPGECPMGSTKNAAGDCVDFMGKVVKKRSTGSDFGNNTQDMKQPGVMDEDYKNPLTGEKPGVIRGADGNLKMNQEDPTFYGDQYAVDVENKRNKGKLTFGKNNTGVSEARLSLFNTGVDMIDSASRNRDYQKAEAEMQEDLNSNNLYASKSTLDKGDYETNSGLFRPDEQGAMRESRSKQYGGDVYQDGGYVEGDEVFMTDEEIQEFLANGGDLEFI